MIPLHREIIATYDESLWSNQLRNALAGGLLKTVDSRHAICVNVKDHATGKRTRLRLNIIAHTKLNTGPWFSLRTHHTLSEPLRVYAYFERITNKKAFRLHYRNYPKTTVDELIKEPAIVTPRAKYATAIAEAQHTKLRDLLPETTLICTFCKGTVTNGIDGWACPRCSIATCVRCLEPCLHIKAKIVN